jgi:Amt family ammonium transporter
MRANRYPLFAIRDSIFVAAIVVVLAIATMAAFGQEAAPPSLEDRVKALETALPNAQTSGDNAWMLTSSALVLLMTGPGLALFYGGLVRRKNVLGTMMQSFMMMALISVIWVVYGYSLAFGEGNAFFGNLKQYFMLVGVGAAPNADYAATIPHQSFMLFQLMFAIITPALITGAFAERMKFNAMVLFMALWATLVYFPLAHMVWGKGGMFNWFFAARIPALDFAGGTVVHISSGVSALICAIVIGRRVGYGKEAYAPHSVVLSFVGACLLWVGWFGFNAGSALACGGLASSAFAATHFATAAAALAWTAVEWVTKGKPSVLGTLSGAVAGLVAITPASGFVTPASSLIIGVIAGIICYLAVTKLKAKFRYDDSLDAFGIHGIGGTVGALLTGIFANKDVNGAIATTFKDAAGNVVSLEGGFRQFLNQAAAVGVAWLIAIVGTFVILMIVKAVVGLRPPEEEERQGLDITQHGEEGYNW